MKYRMHFLLAALFIGCAPARGMKESDVKADELVYGSATSKRDWDKILTLEDQKRLQAYLKASKNRLERKEERRKLERRRFTSDEERDKELEKDSSREYKNERARARIEIQDKILENKTILTSDELKVFLNMGMCYKVSYLGVGTAHLWDTDETCRLVAEDTGRIYYEHINDEHLEVKADSYFIEFEKFIKTVEDSEETDLIKVSHNFFKSLLQSAPYKGRTWSSFYDQTLDNADVRTELLDKINNKYKTLVPHIRYILAKKDIKDKRELSAALS